MKDNLSGIINIGKDTRAQLEQVIAGSFTQLKEAGIKGAFLRMQTLGSVTCLTVLMGWKV